jgi:hypothetical protein
MDRTTNVEMEIGEKACTEIETVMGLMFPVL